MRRIAVILALGSIIGSCSRVKDVVEARPPITVVPTLCNETEPRVEIVKHAEHLVVRSYGNHSYDYLLDLRVHTGKSEPLWLLVNYPYFPARVQEVSKEPLDLVKVRGFSNEYSDAPAVSGDSQEDWAFSGDMYLVKARLVHKPGDTIVRYVRTSWPSRRILVALASIEIDGVLPGAWVADGGMVDHRSTDREDQVSTSVHVDCVDWIEIPPRDGGS